MYLQTSSHYYTTWSGDDDAKPVQWDIPAWQYRIPQRSDLKRRGRWSWRRERMISLTVKWASRIFGTRQCAMANCYPAISDVAMSNLDADHSLPRSERRVDWLPFANGFSCADCNLMKVFGRRQGNPPISGELASVDFEISVRRPVLKWTLLQRADDPEMGHSSWSLTATDIDMLNVMGVTLFNAARNRVAFG